MAKTKSIQPDKAIKSSKDVQVKTLSSVKQGAVTKPSQTSKSKSKDIAKQVALKTDKVGKEEKKSKKSKKVSSSESSSSESDEEEMAESLASEEDDDDESSASSASSDDSEAEIPTPKAAVKINGVKINGLAKAAPNAESEDEESGSSESSASSDDDEEGITAFKSGPAAVAKDAVAGAKEESESEEDSSEEDDSEDDEEKSDEEVRNKGPVNAKDLNGKLEKVASEEVLQKDFTHNLLAVTDVYRSLPTRSLVARTLPLVRLTNHLMRKAKKKRLLRQLLRSARPKLRLCLRLRKPRPSPWLTKLLRGTSLLVVSRIMSTKNGSLASSRASGSYLLFESLLIVTLAVRKGKSTSDPSFETRLTPL